MRFDFAFRVGVVELGACHSVTARRLTLTEGRIRELACRSFPHSERARFSAYAPSLNPFALSLQQKFNSIVRWSKRTSAAEGDDVELDLSSHDACRFALDMLQAAAAANPDNALRNSRV